MDTSAPATRTPAFRLACLSLLLLLVLPASASAANLADHKALLVYQDRHPHTPVFRADVDAVRTALIAGGIPATNIVVEGLPTNSAVGALTGAMATAYGAAGANAHPKIFYYSGHGQRLPNDAAPADEPDIPTARDERMSAVAGRDDAQSAIWTGYTGTKAIFYDQCYAGGMFDGTSDPVPAAPYYMAGVVPAPETSPVTSKFRPTVIRGLAGAADLNSNGEVTAGELVSYMDSQPKTANVYNPVFKVDAPAGSLVLSNVPAAGAGGGAPDTPNGQGKRGDDLTCCEGLDEPCPPLVDACEVTPARCRSVGGFGIPPRLEPSNTAAALAVFAMTGLLVVAQRRRGQPPA